METTSICYGARVQQIKSLGHWHVLNHKTWKYLLKKAQSTETSQLIERYINYNILNYALYQLNLKARTTADEPYKTSVHMSESRKACGKEWCHFILKKKHDTKTIVTQDRQ